MSNFAPGFQENLECSDAFSNESKLTALGLRLLGGGPGGGVGGLYPGVELDLDVGVLLEHGGEGVTEEDRQLALD